MSFIILKFGGTSVSSKVRWEAIRAIIQARLNEGLKPIVVCSALSQASNRLERLLRLAITNEHAGELRAFINRYEEFSGELSVDFSLLNADIHQLSQLIEGISLVGEASPRVQAQVMAYGELLLTKLGAYFLEQSGLSVDWCDVRGWLKSKNERFANEASRYLSAQCDVEFDEALAKQCELNSSKILLTQGFIASNSRGETVLLGRGGSDVSASYLAAKLRANRCEIWTDVPGIYTANPQQIPSARHLKTLDYEEAQEIASMGAKVLHPNAIGPCRWANIPLEIRFTADPEREGTCISNASDDSGVQIKSILTKSGVLLISIETVNMWHQVGFLSDVFDCFKQEGLSIDLVSTSEASVTVSLDRSIAEKDPQAINRVTERLNKFARAKIIGPCASISLVGRNIRAILHLLGGVFEVFEAQKVYLLSQAANDLNLTFVVDDDQALRIAKKLHALLIEQHPKSRYLSKSWEEEFGQYESRPSTWWETKKEKLLAMAAEHSPCYVYDLETVEQSAQRLLKCHNLNRVFYAMKANSNPNILNVLYRLGVNFECVSIHEAKLILSLFPDISPDRILFTPNFAPYDEYAEALGHGFHVTIDNLYVLENWSHLFKGHSVLIRIDPGHGAGHHKFVVTGGEASKFGIPRQQLHRVSELTQLHQICVKGLHVHSGSGILNPDNWRQTAELLTSLMEPFPELAYLDLGGGLGVVERSGQRALDIDALDRSLAVVKEAYPTLELWLEPGRYLVAEAGVLLATVTQLKLKGDTQFIGIDTGMNSLIRPALYGSYHEIVNLSRLEESKQIVANIVGPICESGDTLGYSRLMPISHEKDTILIATAGAYGYTMGSRYNLREPAEEFVVD